VEEPEPLYVDCRTCGSAVPTGLRLTIQIYELDPEEGRELTCPNCGTRDTYTKATFHILSTTIIR